MCGICGMGINAMEYFFSMVLVLPLIVWVFQDPVICGKSLPVVRLFALGNLVNKIK